jgi:hypothetical protein
VKESGRKLLGNIFGKAAINAVFYEREGNWRRAWWRL